MKSTYAALICSLFGLLIFNSSACSDQAIVVGINKYPGLKGGDLNGCVNDAGNMEAALKKHGFEVVKLTDGGATKAGILAALQRVLDTAQPNERIVFYFAGHGTRHADERGALIVYDSGNEESSDLGADQLFDRLKAIRAKAKSVTVLLDSCYSGAMSRAWDRKKRGRFYIRGTKNWRITDAQGDSKPAAFQAETQNSPETNQWDSGGQAGICYFTAASGKEVAEEHDGFMPGGPSSGVFTHFLTQQLNEIAEQLTPWAPVQMKVAGKVAETTENLQHPTLSSAFKDVPIFEAKNTTNNATPNNTTPPITQPKPATVSLWELYQSQQEDPSKISLTVTPDTIPVRVGNKFQLRAKVGQAGYMLLMERATDGQAYLFFPFNGKIEDARVQAGQEILIPGNPQQRLINDAPGLEYGKALLFADSDSGRKLAEALLERFQAAPNAPANSPRVYQPGRKWVTVDQYDWYSADIAQNVLSNEQEIVAK